MKKILITGSGGQLGIRLVSLLKNKYKIIGLTKNDLDITSKDSVKNIIQRHNPDTIINCAAMTDVDGCEENPEIAENINGLSIKNILKNFKGHFIHISTDYVFDGENGPYREEDKKNPINIYGKTKMLGEKIVIKYSNNWTILRSNVLFDLGSKASFVSWVVNSLSNDKDIYVVNDQINNPISINDFTIVIEKIISNNIKGLFHVGSDTFCSRYEFAKIISKIFKLNNKKIHSVSTEYLDQKAKRPLKSGLKTDKLFETIDLDIISLEESIKKLI